MGLYHGSPSIVTNGLILYLDAANKRSYPGSGTTWTDLSGKGYNGVLTNGPTFNSGNGGSIVFNGVNTYINYSSPSVDITNWYSTDYAMDYWIFANAFGSSQNSGTNVLGNAKAGDNTEYWSFGPVTDGTVKFYYWSGRVNTFSTTTTLSTNAWYNLSFVKIGTLLKIFINGIESTSSTLTVSPQSSTSTPLLIGKITNTNSFNGNISNIRMYNRSLSATEIQQNYNVLKGRYGL